ncbi:MAG TPA: radical SAM protein [Burkholderiaceae bacterium]|jgi:anaerobic magnesium-protoporphyrin IX monomethyl ester cyclase
MQSVLIAHSYFLRFDQKQFDRAKPYPPLATLQVAARLSRQGRAVTVFDAMLAESTAEFDEQLARERPQLVLFYEDNFNYLSKMCLGKMREAACQMIESARRGGTRVLVAGSDASDSPEAYLLAGADAVLLGEGLGTLSELLERLDAQPQAEVAALIDGVSGVSALIDGSLRTQPQAPEKSSKVVMLPGSHTQADETAAWELIDIERYRAMWTQAHGRFSLNMAASKGCPFHCNWCAKPIWGNRYIQRSAPAVAAEMLQLKKSFAPDHVWFADDIFGFRADWVQGFAQALQAGGGGVPFTIQSRADLIHPAMAEALKAAGCQEVWLGAESGSQKILDAMDKGTRVEEILEARALLKAQGIRVGFFIQIGYLGENLDDLLATRQLIKNARPDDIGVSVSYPLPGTRFHELVKEQLGGKTHWDDSGDLAMMFQGTYSSAFYRVVRDLLHREVELTPLAPEVAAPARGRLQERWMALIAEERRFRAPTSDPAALAAGL